MPNAQAAEFQLQPFTPAFSLKRGKSVYQFLASGHPYLFQHGEIMINAFRAHPDAGSAAQVWLRIFGKNGEIQETYPLIGPDPEDSRPLRIQHSDRRLQWKKTAGTLTCTVTFYAAENDVWFWNIRTEGECAGADLIYFQDLSVANMGAALANELYVSQYLGFSALEGPSGPILCARQNMPQKEGACPYVQFGVARGGCASYATDGRQFFGLSFRESGIPEGLLQRRLPSSVLQGEAACAVLQTEPFSCRPGEPHTAAFYGVCRENHPEAVSRLEYQEAVRRAAAELEGFAPEESVQTAEAPVFSQRFGRPLVSAEWTAAEISERWPERSLEEWDERGRLQAFFTTDHTHVVLQGKELAVQRPHGHIMTGCLSEDRIPEGLLTVTSMMGGLFMGQLCVGNPSFHKLFSVSRGLYDVQKYAGLRIFAGREGKYRLLTLPAAFEMGASWCRWHYELPGGGERFVVTVYSARDSAAVLEVRTSGKPWDFLLAGQLVLGENEFLQPVSVLAQTGTDSPVLRFRPAPEKRAVSPYPFLRYDLYFSGGAPYDWGGDGVFFADGKDRDQTRLTLRLSGRRRFQMVIRGSLEESSAFPEKKARDFQEETEWANRYFEDMTGRFRLCPGKETDSCNIELQRLNHTVWWFAHHALIHYGSPHGLEQTSGAAWGTRDVCQGPMEFFLTRQKYALARRTLLTLFSHQIFQTGDWPQWFMFDRYPYHAGDCHGDIILWPLKALGDYLLASGDFSVLDQSIPYLSQDFSVSPPPETLLRHVRRAFDNIRSTRLLPGTFLLNYAGGDWDDTLQPADPGMKENLVSAWTVALGCQVFQRLGRALARRDGEGAGEIPCGGISCEGTSKELLDFARNMKADFQRYLIRDGVIAGFLLREKNGAFRCLLHPSDRETGIRLRLLPVTRSMIAGLISPEQAAFHLKLIDERLSCPDGVRLMDRPAPYQGGVSQFFQRAEQAAHVGREIGLQYTHAHIRYIEAMTRLGKSERAWDGLFAVAPAGLGLTVKNALPRQSNLYFSSSEGDFATRYDYARDFDRLREGTVPVRGGWRLYSSGPGIFLRQLVAGVLGLRFLPDALVIDPVLPRRLDGMSLRFDCFGKTTLFRYRLEGDGGSVALFRNGKALAAPPENNPENPYRRGGVVLTRALLLAEEGEIVVVCSGG